VHRFESTIAYTVAFEASLRLEMSTLPSEAAVSAFSLCTRAFGFRTTRKLEPLEPDLEADCVPRFAGKLSRCVSDAYISSSMQLEQMFVLFQGPKAFPYVRRDRAES